MAVIPMQILCMHDVLLSTLVIPRVSVRAVEVKVRDGYLQKKMNLRFQRCAFRILHHNDVEILHTSLS